MSQVFGQSSGRELSVPQKTLAKTCLFFQYEEWKKRLEKS